jgi:hypothetical protein
LLGDPPLDWSQVHSGADYIARYTRMDDSIVGIIRREVLEKHRHALVVYGDVHFWRRNAYWPLHDREKAEMDFAATPNSIVAELEKSGVQVFSVHTNADAAGPCRASPYCMTRQSEKRLSRSFIRTR